MIHAAFPSAEGITFLSRLASLRKLWFIHIIDHCSYVEDAPPYVAPSTLSSLSSLSALSSLRSLQELILPFTGDLETFAKILSPLSKLKKLEIWGRTREDYQQTKEEEEDYDDKGDESESGEEEDVSDDDDEKRMEREFRKEQEEAKERVAVWRQMVMLQQAPIRRVFPSLCDVRLRVLRLQDLSRMNSEFMYDYYCRDGVLVQADFDDQILSDLGY